jgi:hypothetical protein
MPRNKSFKSAGSEGNRRRGKPSRTASIFDEHIQDLRARNAKQAAELARQKEILADLFLEQILSHQAAEEITPASWQGFSEVEPSQGPWIEGHVIRVISNQPASGE